MDELIPETCRHLIAQLSDFLDGTLDAARGRDLQQHLAACPYCRAMAATLYVTIALYRRAPAVTLPREVHARLVGALESVWRTPV